MEKRNTVDLHVLPESCISHILSLTSPRDACRLSVVSSVFQSAADADMVWEGFLPSDIEQILSSSSVSPSLPTFSSKKELFCHLSDNPLLIDDGTKTFALEKCSGKKCYMIGAKGISIFGSYSPIYWNWRHLPESRFSEVAELVGMWWLEIRGQMETQLLSPNTMYEAYLVFKFTETAFGFNEQHVEVSVNFSGGDDAEEGEVDDDAKEGQVKYVYLSQQLGRPDEQVPKERGDEWMEIKMGDFFNERSEDGELEMSLMEIKDRSGKSGLIIEGIELRPKKGNAICSQRY